MNAKGKHRRRTEHLWILALAAAAVMGSFLLTPEDNRRLSLTLPCYSSHVLLPETCMSRIVLGVSCPGCGLTRSFVAIAHGQFWHAFLFNPMGPFLFVLCCLQIPYRIGAYLDLQQFRPLREQLANRADMIIWIVSGGLMISWIARIILEESWSKLF
jgi:hypothetical protein